MSVQDIFSRIDVQRCVLDFWGVLEVFYTLFASRLLSGPCATPAGLVRARRLGVAGVADAAGLPRAARGQGRAHAEPEEARVTRVAKCRAEGRPKPAASAA